MNERMKRVLCALLTAAALFAVTGFALSPEGSRRGADVVLLPSAAPAVTQSPAPQAPTAPPNESTAYAGNANSHVFHRSDCSALSRMAAGNRVLFADRQEAIDAGYSPCKRCNP